MDQSPGELHRPGGWETIPQVAGGSAPLKRLRLVAIEIVPPLAATIVFRFRRQFLNEYSGAESDSWSGEVLLHFLERRFAEVQGEIEAVLSTSTAYFMRDPVFSRAKNRGGFVVVAIVRYDWANTLSAEQRAFLRRHCEAVYISRGFPPSEDDLPQSAG